MSSLVEFVSALREDRTFQNLVRELPELLTRVRSIAGVRIGVNLDDQLLPVEATLLSITKEKFGSASRTLFNRIFGRGENAEDARLAVRDAQYVVHSTWWIRSGRCSKAVLPDLFCIGRRVFF